MGRGQGVGWGVVGGRNDLDTIAQNIAKLNDVLVSRTNELKN